MTAQEIYLEATRRGLRLEPAGDNPGKAVSAGLCRRAAPAQGRAFELA